MNDLSNHLNASGAKEGTMQRPRRIRGELYLTVPEAAEQLKIGRMTLYRWAAKGQTPQKEPLKVLRDVLTGHYYIAVESVEKLARLYGREEDRFEFVCSNGMAPGVA
jgi:predicted DNA-binding transcriptional regulator AlpA